jgi:hypothetical protein
MTRLNVTVFFLVGLLTASPALAQLGEAPMPQASAKNEGPTLEETQKWIVAKMREMETGNDGKSRYEASFNSCEFSILETYGSFGGYLWEGNLKDISDDISSGSLVPIGGSSRFDVLNLPHGITDSATQLSASSGNIEALRRLFSAAKSLEGDGKRAVSMIWLQYAQPGFYGRILNAYVHAGKLCRALEVERRQAQEAATAKKPGEPF